MHPDHFREEMVFAKVVSTKEGNAMLVAGNVLHITGPQGVDWVDVVTRALRRQVHEVASGEAGQ